MEKEKILIIEDESSILDILTYVFKKEGYEVQEVQSFAPHLILLDIMLPDVSGFDICKTITAKFKTPIIMLTARSDIIDKVLGLELGADDYIPKPFDVREVLARVRAVLRRVKG